MGSRRISRALSIPPSHASHAASSPPRVATEPVYPVVKVQSYSTRVRSSGIVCSRAFCHSPASCTWSGGSPSACHPLSASLAPKERAMPDSSCVMSSREPPNTISGRWDALRSSSYCAIPSAPRMLSFCVRMHHPWRHTPRPPSSTAPPSAQSALIAGSSASSTIAILTQSADARPYPPHRARLSACVVLQAPSTQHQATVLRFLACTRGLGTSPTPLH
mmetsp:Transcript_24344/g.76812  ORF Transcript_24344/g.76812 Transcript_24344/m.76812 type:complete len:219 (-) Transcript_24344:76-732(-)